LGQEALGALGGVKIRLAERKKQTFLGLMKGQKRQNKIVQKQEG